MMDGNRQKPVSFACSEITGGFWKKLQDTTRKVTLEAVYDRFEETGRFEALKQEWVDKMPNRPHIFWDSDVAKWIEGAAYFLQKERDAELEERIDRLVERMKAGQRQDGYLNSYFQTVEPDAVFTRRGDHELYCAGHLIEAAIAYAQAVGKKDMLDVMLRYADLIDRVFRVEHSASFDTPGHEEIELALVKLYRYTGEERYLKLAEYFINTRGASTKDGTDPAELLYTQSHIPVRKQVTADGHCVRALYLYCGMMDLAAETRDEALLEASRKLFDNIAEKRMYITGGVGSTWRGEAFTFDYDLPEYEAYNETCASIALAYFCRRLWLAEPDGRYADCAEQAVYNTVLSGVSLEGDRFFYENPVSSDPRRSRFNASRVKRLQEHLPILERVKVFDCSCCPPNLLRMIASAADMMYSVSGDTIYAHCYMEADTELKLKDQTVKLSQKTEYPYDGRVEFEIGTEGSFTIAVRIPGWCEKALLSVNGSGISGPVRRGYAYVSRFWKKGDRLTLDMEMTVRMVSADPRVIDACGRAAVQRGPLIYCAEGIDNQDRPLRAVRLALGQASRVSMEEIGGHPMPVIRMLAACPIHPAALYAVRTDLEEYCELTLIPYFARANRGVTEMTTWFRV